MNGDLYLWVKAAHIISVIAWMAGLLYLPRLYVYHVAAESGSKQSETFKVMERRLLFVIIHPGMLASIVTGTALLLMMDNYGQVGVWMWAKLVIVIVGLGSFQVYLGRWRKKFELDENTCSETFFRCVNEIPTVLMVLIVLLAIVKPW